MGKNDYKILILNILINEDAARKKSISFFRGRAKGFYGITEGALMEFF